MDYLKTTLAFGLLSLEKAIHRQMSKKKKEIKSAAKPESYGKPQKSDAAADAKEENKDPFDFGGLPARDLKKNLGCG